MFNSGFYLPPETLTCEYNKPAVDCILIQHNHSYQMTSRSAILCYLTWLQYCNFTTLRNGGSFDFTCWESTAPSFPRLLPPFAGTWPSFHLAGSSHGEYIYIFFFNDSYVLYSFWHKRSAVQQIKVHPFSISWIHFFLSCNMSIIL